ncbi:hypothetical protein LEP1GSC059_0495 [Leptospira noguchii serovar Panama str. CZ214]|uniref:Uncharacterized protein n=1 Tax=Leptospira noguchii serovar Panama str. CZ214 TaxID=1001595 RepID=T0FIU0_9LEPT|nr:hypothetical protein LEP1GSC059_0495 [Leptospira noguchii serovar Panama str. CZ214]
MELMIKSEIIYKQSEPRHSRSKKITAYVLVGMPGDDLE